MAITWEQIEERKKRLTKLGLGKEIVLLDEHDHPLLYIEQLAYLKAIRAALAGVESASVVLAKARQRHRDAARGK